MEDSQHEDDPDILRVPSPPPRRLSRSSIDLRDLEQQQLPQHDRVSHTDSAPSVIALENSFKVNKSKTDNFLQPQPVKSNFLHKPFECFSRVRKPPVTLTDDGALTFENDNLELARFIEDNYQYFRKQNSNLELPASDGGRTLAQLQQACSDSDFLTLKNNVDSGDASDAGDKKSKSKKHKMSAISDSDFMVSVGRQPSLARKLTVKSKIPFARTILHAKMQRPGKYNALDPQLPPTSQGLSPFCMGEDKENVSNNCTLMGLNSMNNNLSRSLNGCYRRNNESLHARSLQRVHSDGHDATVIGNGRHKNSTEAHQQPPPTYDAFEMFIKLFNCEKNNKNICDKQSNKFNYKIVVNSKEFDYSDNVLVNYKRGSCEKMRSLHDFVRANADSSGAGASATAPSSGPGLAKSSSDQMMMLNSRDDNNFVYVLNSDINLHNSHVLVNNFVITSPPLTPKLRSPKSVNRGSGSGGLTALDATGYQHLNDIGGLSIDVGTASPIDHLVGAKTEPELLLDLKLAPATNNGVNGNIADASANFIKNNLALTSSGNQGVVKRDKCSGARKPSVTYDINVINRSQDFNIDEMCQPTQQRNSYALRSGSTSSTSRCPRSHSILSYYILEISYAILFCIEMK